MAAVASQRTLRDTIPLNRMISNKSHMALINPHINFNGNAEEAFNFYKSVFGGEFAKIMRLKDIPGLEHVSANDANK